MAGDGQKRVLVLVRCSPKEDAIRVVGGRSDGKCARGCAIYLGGVTGAPPRMNTIISEHRGWAISTGSEAHGLIGKFWVFNGSFPIIDQSMDGYRVAVFKTRAEARCALVDVKRAFPRAKVQRVTVSISI